MQVLSRRYKRAVWPIWRMSAGLFSGAWPHVFSKVRLELLTIREWIDLFATALLTIELAISEPRARRSLSSWARLEFRWLWAQAPGSGNRDVNRAGTCRPPESV